MQTAIAQTAAAAHLQTAAAAQGQALPSPVLREGPTLDPQAFGTAVALTVAAAQAGTQAMIPDTLTPSVTPLPSHTPSITPTVTHTFVLTAVPTITRLPASPTGSSRKKKDGGDGGGGIESPYSCRVVGVVPKNQALLPVNTEFDINWVVKNKGQNWPHKSLSITYVEGTLVRMTAPNDLNLPKWEISGGDEVNLPPITMRTPFEPGVYSTWWRLNVKNIPVCNLTLTVIVR